jgi:phage-related protein
MSPLEPQSAADYDDRSTEAVKSVLIEIGQILGSYKDKFMVVGGLIPWLLQNDEEMPHVGTIDIDLGLDPSALADGEYANLIELLKGHGYRQRDDLNPDLKPFQLVRELSQENGSSSIEVVVDFLMQRNVKVFKNRPPLVEDLRVQEVNGADLAIRLAEDFRLNGTMPGGGTNTVTISVCSIPAFLVMKGFAVQMRHKQKDAYDIYYVIRNYSGGIPTLAEACRPVLEDPEGREGYGYIDGKFGAFDDYGPTSVRKFVEETDVLQERTPDQWQQDAFGVVDQWLKQLGLRES